MSETGQPLPPPPGITLPPRVKVWPDEIEEQFVRASGPGGQNVNKVSTAVQLRFDTARARGLPQDVKDRLRTLAGRRMSKEGVLIIDARRFRTQERNREDARERLFALLAQAAVVPVKRRATKMSRAARARRMDSKTKRGNLKRLRSKVGPDS